MKDKCKLPQLQLVTNPAVPKNRAVVIPDLNHRMPPPYTMEEIDEIVKRAVMIVNIRDKNAS